MQVRFTGIYTGQRGRALRLTDALDAAFATDQVMKGLLQSVKSAKLTTLGRLVSDPDFRSLAGIEMRGDTLTSLRPLTTMREFWLKIFGDLASNLTVSSLKNKEQRAAYMSTISSLVPETASENFLPAQASTPEGDPAQGQLSLTPADQNESEPGQAQIGDDTRTPATSSHGGSPSRPSQPIQGTNTRTQSQRARPMKLFHGLRLLHVGPKAKDVLREAQRIDITQFPNAGAALVRILVELVVGETVERLGWEARPELRDRINACLTKLDPTNKSDRYLSVRRALSDRDNPFSMRSMQGYLHNAKLPADPLSLRALSETYATLLGDLDTRLGSTA
ncbi:hypothetical protein GCM10010151_55740 [Actinoallomurus spadix]|uniref:Uncharacterized protein n=2 Tax=Actinoallomurus spadix TaxID=79912 RepID=A0ABN0X9Y6_9ACTN